jgi:hypothetical protein
MPTLGTIRPLLVLTVLIAMLAVAGCGSDSDETTGGGAQAAPAPAEDRSTTTAPEQAPPGVRAEPCRSDDAGGGEVRVTGVPCGFGRLVVTGWHKNEACDPPPGASRTSCKLGGFTCLGAATGQGLAVTCATSGRSVAFIAKR